MPDSAPRIRALVPDDVADALTLYNQLTVGPAVQDVDAFHAVLRHSGTTVFGADLDGGIRAMATLHILPNVTWQARPYALIENVVTDETWQRRGLGRLVLQAAIDAACEAGAYKVMLMTGQKRGAKLFYEKVGFSGDDKFAMVLRRD